jgi:hypothetical protein
MSLAPSGTVAEIIKPTPFSLEKPPEAFPHRRPRISFLSNYLHIRKGLPRIMKEPSGVNGQSIKSGFPAALFRFITQSHHIPLKIAESERGGFQTVPEESPGLAVVIAFRGREGIHVFQSVLQQGEHHFLKLLRGERKMLPGFLDKGREIPEILLRRFKLQSPGILRGIFGHGRCAGK